jgi:murein DD-endopeptidase MepM/ murein hydrolase activator NlpD
VSLTTTELSNVIAPQNAIVSRIEFDENQTELATLFLDHGRGLYSIISGMSDLTVEIGNGVIAGAVLGKMPLDKTGSPTTLIWQCVINGVYINPLILTKI